MKMDNIPGWVWLAIMAPISSVLLFFNQVRGVEAPVSPTASSSRDLGDLGSLGLDSKNPVPVRRIVERLSSGELRVTEEGSMPICYLDDSLLRYSDNMDVFRSAYEHPGTRFALAEPDDTHVFHRTSFLGAKEFRVIKNSLVYDKTKLKFTLGPPIIEEKNMAGYIGRLIVSSVLFLILMSVCLLAKNCSGELWFETNYKGVSDLGHVICVMLLLGIMFQNAFFGLRASHTSEIVFSIVSALSLVLWWVGSDSSSKRRFRVAGYVSLITGGFSVGYVLFGEWLIRK